MAHVLLCGSAPLINEVHAHLGRWGVTVELLLEEPETHAAVSLASCDAFVVACSDCETMGWCPNRLVREDDTAPMLLVGGGPGRRTCRQNCRVNIERISPEGRNLRQALDTCLTRSEQLRNKSQELHGYQEYMQFLSHELKTPLTAAQTALQLLAQDREQVGEDRRREFVDIALRNLKRLGNTITWSEDYLTARVTPVAPSWQRQSARELIVEALRAEGVEDIGIACEDGAGPVEIVTDIQLLRSLLRQVGRALRYHAPQTGLELRLSVADGEARDRLELTYLAADHPAVPGGVSRTSLVDRADAPQGELQRLLEFTVPSEVVETLGAELTVPSAPADPAAMLVLSLPLSPAGSRAGAEAPVSV